MKLLQKTIPLLAVISLLSIAGVAHAEEATVNATVNTTVETPKQTVPRNEMDARREALKRDMEMKKMKAVEIKDKRTEIKADVKANVEIRKEDRATTTAARKDDRRMKAETMIKKQAGQMTERLNAAVERLEKIATRIDSRIAKLKAEGVVTTSAETSVASARATIVTIKADIATIPTVLASSFSQTELKGSLKPLETLAVKIRGEIQSAHKSLETAVSALKAVSPKPNTEVKTDVKAEVKVENNDR